MRETAVAEPPPVLEATPMPSPTAVDQIMETVAKLSEADRAELIERLDEGFEEEQWDPEERAAFLAELDRRRAEHLRDPSKAVDAEEVLRRLGLEDTSLT